MSFGAVTTAAVVATTEPGETTLQAFVMHPLWMAGKWRILSEGCH